MDEPTATDFVSEWHNYFQSLVTGGDAPCPLDPVEPPLTGTAKPGEGTEENPDEHGCYWSEITLSVQQPDGGYMPEVHKIYGRKLPCS
jgi:hypothetical protein